MTIRNPFKTLSRMEKMLWGASVLIISASFLLCGTKDLLTLTASLIGVTALIFVAKGQVIGQLLTVVFAVFYGVISCWFRYYGEMITYLGMTSPIAILAVIEWLRHPFQDSAEVAVSRVTLRQTVVMLLLTALTTAGFYFILRALNTASLMLSTVSVATSFLASYLTYLRSPYYAVGYAANDLVLIGLWSLAFLQDPSCLPMIVCFAMFFLNDAYGFVNWQRMQRRQEQFA